MGRWTQEKLRELMDEMLGSADPGDPRERKRLRIVAAATELFIKQGYRKTTIDEVARRAGVAKGTVYLYVKNKGGLLYHAIGEEKRKHVMHLLEDVLDPQLAGKEQLRRWIKLALLASARMPLVSRLMSGNQELLAAMHDIPPELMQRQQEIGIDFASDLLERGAAPHRWTESGLKDRAQVLMGLMHFAMLVAEPRVLGHLSQERYAELVADMLLHGVAPPDNQDKP